MAWTVETINSVAEMVTDKIEIKNLTIENYISTENMLPNRQGVELASKIPSAGNVNAFRAGDVLFSNIRTYFKKVWLAPCDGGASADVIIFRPRNTSKILNEFLFYLLSSDAFIDSTVTASKGTKMPRGDKDAMRAYEFCLPTLNAQQRIVDILSVYDELIENSQRRIKILESMARALYREWFVNFRYPGNESVSLVPSTLGDIPRGWEVIKLADLVTTQYGYTESTNAEPVGPKYLRGMDINKTSFIDWSIVPYCPISPEDYEKYRLRVGDIVVIRMADPGKVGIVEQEIDAVFASYLIRVTPKNCRLSPYFLFYLMESAEYYGFITGASTGATRKSASAGVIAEYEFVLPPQELVEEFEQRVSEIRLMLTTTLTKIVNLRRTRELLLPRLLSGQIEVEVIA